MLSWAHIGDLHAYAPLGTDAHAVEARPGHGLLGTQLAPNKHGRKW